MDQSLETEKSSADDKSASQASTGLTDPVSIIDQMSASPCSESVSFFEKPDVLHQTTGVLVAHDDQSSSQSNVVNSGWLDCKPVVGSEVIPVDLQAMFVDGCQLINSSVPALFISPSTMNDDVSSAVFVEMDTNPGSITASASSDEVPVAAVGLPDQYTLTIDHSSVSDSANLPVLIRNDSIEVMLTESSATAVHSRLDSSVIACPIITTSDSLASVRVTTLPSSRVVLFSSTCPAPSTSAIVPAGAYQVIQDANQLSAAFPSPCTPGTSDVAFTSVQELTVPQVINPLPGTPGMLQAACQSHVAVDQLPVSFPTPQTPGQPQLKTPTGANYFRFSVANGGVTSGIVDTLPKTPVYTVAFTQPMMGRQLFSPKTPYTPATPSIFQFPPTASVSAVHESAGKCSSPFMIQKHPNNYHPYGQPAALELSSPHFQRLHQAAIRKAEERKKFEQDVAEAHHEIEHHLKQLQQEDMIRQQRKQLLNSESQVGESRPDTGSRLNVPASSIVPADLHQRVDDVFQVLAEEAEDMDTACGDFTGTPHRAKTECMSVNTPLQSSGTSDVWIIQNSVESLKKMKRKQKPEPLVIPDSMSNFKHVTNQVIHCQLPVVRDIISGSHVTPYTPPPMRSPLWTGLGVNKTLVNSGVPLSAPPYKSWEPGKDLLFE